MTAAVAINIYNIYVSFNARNSFSRTRSRESCHDRARAKKRPDEKNPFLRITCCSWQFRGRKSRKKKADELIVATGASITLYYTT